MFGALRRRRGLQVARRSKGRVAAWIATVVVAAIVIGEVAADVVNSSGPASVMSDRTYAAAVVPIIDESTALLPWLTDVRTKPVSLGRAGIESALGHLVSGSANVELQLAQLGIAPPSARAGYAQLIIAYARANEPVTIDGEGTSTLLITEGGVDAGAVVADRVFGLMRRISLETTIRAGVAALAGDPEAAISTAHRRAEGAAPASAVLEG